MQRSVVPLPDQGNVVFLRLKAKHLAGLTVAGRGCTLYEVREHQDYGAMACPIVEVLRLGRTAVFRSAWIRDKGFSGESCWWRGGAPNCRSVGSVATKLALNIRHVPPTVQSLYLSLHRKQDSHTQVLSLATDGAIGGCRGWGGELPTGIRFSPTGPGFRSILTHIMTEPVDKTPGVDRQRCSTLPLAGTRNCTGNIACGFTHRA